MFACFWKNLAARRSSSWSSPSPQFGRCLSRPVQPALRPVPIAKQQKIGEESVRIGKENTTHNAAMLAQSDRHNRLSVRPVLIKFNSFDIEDGGVSFVTGIRNSGMGPAVIRYIKFFHKGEEVTAPIWSDAPLEVVKLCLANVNLRWWARRHGSLGKGSALIVGKESVLLEVFFPFEQKQGDRTSKKTADYIKKIVDEASAESGYEVVFTSVYGDEQFDPLRT
jgi:hypothetical protein